MTQNTEQLTPMQAALLERADAIFNSIGGAVQKAGDLAWKAGEKVAAEIPEVAIQYVAYGRALETALMVIGLMMVFLGLWLLVRLALMNVCKLEDDYRGPHDGRIYGGAFGAVIAAISSIFVLTHIKGFFLVWFAPKVWLLLELVNLVKMVKS